MNKRVAVYGSDGAVMALLGRQAISITSAQPGEFDALVLLRASAPPQLISDFHRAQRPIAAFGSAVEAVAHSISGVTVCRTGGEVAGVFYEDCADGDFVSDREKRVITAPTLSAAAVRELLEMA
jgi:hypothetical protein